MNTQEIARIVASNTARIDLPTWLRLEHELEHLPALAQDTRIVFAESTNLHAAREDFPNIPDTISQYL